jgi:glycosyltransferase involved in cell wall biosynthesis
MSEALIVHNRYSYNRLAADYTGLRVKLIPHATPRRNLPSDPAALRAKYGFRPDDLILASISTIAHNKRLDLTFAAIRRAHAKYPKLRFVIVGAGELGNRAGLIQRYGLRDCVVQTGWVTSQQYLDYIDLADVAIDLRYPTAGETSGSALRAMQAGKPLVVSEQGSFLELPDEACIRLPIGGADADAVYAALDSLLSNPDRRLRMGAAGREFAHSRLQIEQAAASYLELAREVASQPKGARKVWKFRQGPDRSVRGRLIASIYKAGRLGYYCRRYGVKGTLKRIRSA